MAAAWTILSFVLALWWAPPPSAAPAPTSHPQPAPTFPPHGGAFVTSLPGTASAWLDGTYVGPTPVYVDDLLPGHHSVTLSSAGWQPQSTAFDVSIGRITPVSVIMQRVAAVPPAGASKGQGMLAIVGGPAGARVYVDGVAIGAMPVEPHSAGAGYHIVTLEPIGKNAVKSTRIVNVFPNVTTAVAFAAASATTSAPPPDDILEPVDSIVPPNGIVMSGNDVTIHYRNVEIQCAIGSRSITFNGRAETLGIPPALVGGKVYLPLSLLQRLAGK
jgi:hypothetical protein